MFRGLSARLAAGDADPESRAVATAPTDPPTASGTSRSCARRATSAAPTCTRARWARR